MMPTGRASASTTSRVATGSASPKVQQQHVACLHQLSPMMLMRDMRPRHCAASSRLAGSSWLCTVACCCWRHAGIYCTMLQVNQWLTPTPTTITTITTSQPLHSNYRTLHAISPPPPHTGATTGHPAGRGSARVDSHAGSYKAVAYMVNIKDAGAPDQRGLVQMLLRYWQAGLVPDTAFALPALHAIIDFK
jgi:hypothetical protein